jgi:hypothetical protein
MRAARLPVFSLLELISSASNFYSPGYPLEIFFSTHIQNQRALGLDLEVVIYH